MCSCVKWICVFYQEYKQIEEQQKQEASCLYHIFTIFFDVKQS